MVFRLEVPIELERPGSALAENVQVTICLIYERGRWRGMCQNPPVSTLLCDSMEEALKTAAKEVQADWSRVPQDTPVEGVSL